MLIDVVHCVHMPERPAVPSFVRLDSIDGLYSSITHTLYFLHLSGFVFCGRLKDGEIYTFRPRSGRTNLHQVHSEMVERTPEILNHIAENCRKLDRNYFDKVDVIGSLSRPRIVFKIDNIWVSGHETIDGLAQLENMLLGSFGLDG